jgi:phosphonate dehydrogenase
MIPPRVVVTGWVHSEVVEFLAAGFAVDANPERTPWPRAELLARARDADALLAFMTDHVDADFLARCPRLRIVAGALKGYDNFDAAACTARGVWLTVVPDLLTEPTAELTVGLMIALARNLVAGDRLVRGGGFAGWRPILYGTGLKGAVVGIVGMGAVGCAVAERLRGFGPHLVYSDPRDVTAAAALGAERVPLATLLAAGDFVVLALPLAADTAQLIDRAALQRMKPGALLINPARGSLVDEAAVAQALAAGRLAGYAADVFAMEDWARPDRPAEVLPALRESPRTVLTPHLGSAVDAVRREIALEAARSIIDCFAGRTPRGAVNRPQSQPRP